MANMTAVFRGTTGEWDIADVTVSRNATVTDVIDALTRMGLSSNIEWTMTLTLFGTRRDREDMIRAAEAAEAAEAARLETAALNGWTR